MIAAAQFNLSREQNELNGKLAELEIASAKPDLEVVAGQALSNLLYAGEPLTTQAPTELRVKLLDGVLRSWTASGRSFIFISALDGYQRCPLAIHGVYKQIVRGELEFVAEKDLQALFDAFESAELKVEGLHSELIVIANEFDDTLNITNLTLDGSEYAVRPDLIEPVIYSGAWSGGVGFYFDELPAAEYCPILREQILALIDSTGGASGDEMSNISPSDRMIMRQP